MDTTRKNTMKKNKPKKGGGILRAIGYIFLFIVAAIIVGGVAVWIYVNSIVSQLDDIDPNQVSEQLYENSVIVDSSGRVLEYIQNEGLRKVVKYSDISPAVIDAFIAVEDKTFMTHNGFNYVRIIGATVKHFLNNESLGGVSTITQQLARNVYLFDRRQERTLNRKIAEAYYTVQLEKYLTKEQIIEGYLNLVFFGMESYGVEAAANTYFGKSAKELDYMEAALLVGTVKGPSLYAPMMRYNKDNVPADAYIIDDEDQFYTIVFNEDCLDRYYTCLDLMYENGKITEKEYKEGKEYDIRTKLKFVQPSGTEISSYFSDVVKQEVIADLMEKYRYSRKEAVELLHSGGLKIVSTIDFDCQKTLESHYEKDNFNYYYGDSLEEAVRLFQESKGLEATGAADVATLDAFCEATDIERDLFPDDIYAKGTQEEQVQLLKKGLYKLGFFVVNEYFPKISPCFDAEGNILNKEGQLLLPRYDNVIDSEGNLVIKSDEYEFTNSGSLKLLRYKSLYFFPHYEDDMLTRIQINVTKTFKLPNGYDPAYYVNGWKQVDSIQIYSGHEVLIPDEYKKMDEDGNVIISRQFIKENPDFFQRNDEDDSLRISSENFVISQTPVIQPQSAMVITDPYTGHVKALVGGRNMEGAMLYNRATNPRQPGSAIKPISAYTAAMKSGNYSPSSVIDDRPRYLAGNTWMRWPKNWYETYGTATWYYGLTTIREAFEMSSNVPPAYLTDQLGVETVAQCLKDYGVTSIVEEGPVNDMNISALALGGMSRGISPMEMAQAYGCIANDGMLNKSTTYIKVMNNRGEVLLEKTPNPTRVLDENVAYLIKDLLRTAVSNGLASRASMATQTVYGKTGTTSDQLDVWFVGFTPYYVGAVWFGNDLNIPVSKGSEFTADFWQKVMTDLHKDLERKEFPVPDGIVTAAVDVISGKLPSELSAKDPRNTIRSDIFIRGFVPAEQDDVHVEVRICKATGKLATEFCPDDMVETRVMVQRPEPYDPSKHENIKLRDSAYDAPTQTCDAHNEKTHKAYLWEQNIEYKGQDPLKKLNNGDIIVTRYYPVEMLDGNIKTLPPSTIIRSDGTITLPDGTVIPNGEIFRIQQYDASKLDEFYGLDKEKPQGATTPSEEATEEKEDKTQKPENTTKHENSTEVESTTETTPETAEDTTEKND